jgi:hypothetical protein
MTFGVKRTTVNEKNPRTYFNIARDVARATTQGLTLGFADEIEAGVRSAFDSNKSYTDIVKEVRGQIKDFRKSNPGTAIGTEIAGAILPTIAAQFIPGLGQTASVANTARLANIAKGAGVAGAEGLVYGVGTAEGGLGERLTNPNTAISGATSAVRRYNSIKNGRSYRQKCVFLR